MSQAEDPQETHNIVARALNIWYAKLERGLETILANQEGIQDIRAYEYQHLWPQGTFYACRKPLNLPGRILLELEGWTQEAPNVLPRDGSANGWEFWRAPTVKFLMGDL